MPRTIYCWRCNADMPMLTEDEWQIVNPMGFIAQVKQYREETGCTLSEAKERGLGYQSLAAYERITGFKETNPNALLHHRLSLYGAPCHACGKPLRTPVANYCAACGAARVATRSCAEAGTKAIAIEISRWVDDAQPGWVECKLVDAKGWVHLFVEKGPVVTAEPLGPESSYPRPGSIACEIEAELTDAAGRSLARVSTTRPWDVASSAGESTFVVLASQLVDW
ncbi:hypothetical protein [Variovorax sp. GB1P17]|uniref:hypothetical protein n=1 Tax=Variovorax sp. GB1P17 TaxID=3443740 RepID=UPI003F471BD4